MFAFLLHFCGGLKGSMAKQLGPRWLGTSSTQTLRNKKIQNMGQKGAWENESSFVTAEFRGWGISMQHMQVIVTLFIELKTFPAIKTPCQILKSRIVMKASLSQCCPFMFSVKLCGVPVWTLMNEVFADFYCDMGLTQSAQKFSYPELEIVQMDLKSHRALLVLVLF